VNELKAVVKQVVSVQVGDLEKFVKECYGVASWNFNDQAMGLYDTDTFVVYQVDGSTGKAGMGWLNRWLDNPSDELDPNPLLVLNDLARRGLIVKGEYLIEDRRFGSGIW
jgi:hypothetical protein